MRRTRRSASWPARAIGAGRRWTRKVPRDEHHDAVVLEVQARRDHAATRGPGPGQSVPGAGPDRSTENHETPMAPGHRPGRRVTLLLPGTGPIDPEQLAAIREAAAPLIHLLSERRLIQLTLEGRRR